VPTVFFITHPDVAIDPIPDWPLNSRGWERMRAIMGWSWARGVRRVFASSERKARDAGEILAAGLGLTGYGVVAALGEADRSATGYLPRQEFEETADAFFAHPQQSVRGWEPAARAQARIVGAVERVASHPRTTTTSRSSITAAPAPASPQPARRWRRPTATRRRRTGRWCARPARRSRPTVGSRC
jgi:broad specificity phosphatase PhoE